jgi:hypothetical protein
MAPMDRGPLAANGAPASRSAISANPNADGRGTLQNSGGGGAAAAAVQLERPLELAQLLHRKGRMIEVTMKTGGLISAATQTKRRLLSDTRGSMTIPALFFFTILTAIGGLAIDIQRVYGVHGQMQAYVDNVALAAAAELDGEWCTTRSFGLPLAMA